MTDVILGWGTVIQVRERTGYLGVSVEIDQSNMDKGNFGLKGNAICAVRHGSDYEPEVDDEVAILMPANVDEAIRLQRAVGPYKRIKT